MPKTKDNNGLTATVRKLRLALELTQQEFAERLGLGIATIVRYERNRLPDARALGRLEQVAEEHGFEEFAKTFRSALAAELTTPIPPREAGGPFHNDDERSHTMALLKVLRQERYAKEAKAIRRMLGPIIDADRQRRELDEAIEAQRQAIVRLLGAGYSAEEVIGQFRTTEQAVAEAFLARGSSVLVEKRMPEIFKLLQSRGWNIRRMATEVGGGDAIPFLDCARELGENEAIREYEESIEEGEDA
jgi:transcriptional regulator with XRE-family HTH domain